MPGKVEVCCLIGDPVEHSLSPLIHNTAFRKLKLNFTYIAFKVSKNELKKAIEGLKALNVRGINVTIPHKTEVIKYLDQIDCRALEVNAVNTIVNYNGVLKGFNTDVAGILRTLEERKISVKGKKAVIMGAGGIARAATYALAMEGAREIIIANRTLTNAVKLARELKKSVKVKVRTLPLTVKALKTELKVSDMVVNCTPVGMSPHTDKTPIPKELLHEDLVVMDAVYNPLRTRLLREAEEVGARIVDGLSMLIYQGAEAFKLWTGREPPINSMRRAALRVLRGENW